MLRKEGEVILMNPTVEFMLIMAAVVFSFFALRLYAEGLYPDTIVTAAFVTTKIDFDTNNTKASIRCYDKLYNLLPYNQSEFSLDIDPKDSNSETITDKYTKEVRVFPMFEPYIRFPSGSKKCKVYLDIVLVIKRNNITYNVLCGERVKKFDFEIKDTEPTIALEREAEYEIERNIIDCIRYEIE